MVPLPGNVVEANSARDLDDWLSEHGESEREVWVVIYKKASGKQTVRYEDLLPIAIRYGWIDVMDKRVDDERYGLRYRPRRQGGNWTPGNLRIAEKLIAEGRMTERGLTVMPNRPEP